jgi:hypothetical protein
VHGNSVHVQLGTLRFAALGPRVSESLKELFEFIATAMQIADDVKGSLLRLAIVPQGSPDDLCLVDLLLVLELDARSKALKTNSTEFFS